MKIKDRYKFSFSTQFTLLVFASLSTLQLSHVMKKPTFCICVCKNKDPDQLHGNRKADQRLCFRYIDIAIPLLSKSEISSLYPSSVAAQPGLCWTRSETKMLIFSCRSSTYNFSPGTF